MQMQPGLRALTEKIASLREWQAEHEALRAELANETKGAELPALVALTDSLGTFRREMDAAAASVEALERLGAAIEGLGDAPERERYIGTYNAALRALERRLGEDGPVGAAVNATLGRVAPATAEAEAEIARRRYEAAEKEAREREAEEHRETEERKRNALASAEAASAALAKALPEADEALAAVNELAA